MTTDDIPNDAPLTGPDLDQALAAEYALGLLDHDEARMAHQRVAQDADFARDVRMWQERLAAMADDLTPVMPPARARQAIRERLGHATAPLATDPNERAPWWRGGFGVLAGLLVAAGLALFVVMPAIQTRTQAPATDGQQAAYRAQLVSDDRALQVEARLSGRDMQVALHAGASAAGHDWELWWIGPDGSAPVSLGLVPDSGDLRISLPQALQPQAGVRLAVSDEPEGGSPTGQATGPVVAVAELTSL